MFYSDLKSYQIDMRDNGDKKYTFILNGICLYFSNKSSSCGWGSDDWCFSSKCDNKDCILRFSCSAEVGSIWDCVFISSEEASLLIESSEEIWQKILQANYSKTKIPIPGIL